MAGVEGQPPRYRLEYESKNWRSEKHFRYHSSSLRSDEIRRYIWPGIVSYDEENERETDTVVYKGVVVT